MASGVISFSDKHAAEVNRKALARADPAVEEVIVTVAHSAIYDFDQPRGAWIKLEQEGPLFVVRRSSAPIYRIVLMNRLSATNFILDLTGEVKVDRKDSLAMLHLPNQGRSGMRVFGFWSHSAEGLTELVAALESAVSAARSHTATEAKTPAPAPAPAKVASDSTEAASDAIKGMLGIGAAAQPAPAAAPKQGTTPPGTRGASQATVGTRGRRGASGAPPAAAAAAGAAAGSAATSSGAGASDGAGAGSGRPAGLKKAAKASGNGAAAGGKTSSSPKTGLASVAGTALATGSAGITPASGKPVDRAALRDALVALAEDDDFMSAVARAYEKAMAAKAKAPSAGAASSSNGSARPPSASSGTRGNGSRSGRRARRAN